MEQGLPRGTFSTAARLMGMMALMPVMHYWRTVFLVFSGESPMDFAVLVNCGVGTVACAALAIVMIVPSFSVGFIRRRMDWPGRIGFFLLKSLYAVIVPLHFLLTVGSFPVFQPLSYFILLGIISLAGTFFIGSVFPGDLARALVRRESQNEVDRRLRALAAMRTNAAFSLKNDGVQEQEIYRVDYTGANQTSDSDAAPIEQPASPKKKIKYETDGRNPFLDLIAAPFILIGVAMGGLSVFGWRYASFTPNAEVYALYHEYELLIVAGMGVCGYLGSVLYVNNRLSLFPSLRRSWIVVFAAALYMTLAFKGGSYALLAGGPDLLSRLESQQAEGRMQMYVLEQGPVNVAGCNYMVRASWREDLEGPSVDVCRLAPRLWENIRRGQRLTLIGTQTPFGIRYHTVTGLTAE